MWHEHKLWILSMVAAAAMSAFDCYSSMGHQELNPALRNRQGNFGTQGILIKSAGLGIVMGFEIPIMKQTKKEKWFVIENFALAGLTGGTAVRNELMK